MDRLLKRLLLGIGIGVLLYAVAVVTLGVRDVGQALATFDYGLAPLVLGLTLFNYALRYAKWSFYLKVLDAPVKTSRNIHAFCAGLSMVITPGKLGELLKGYLLRRSDGLPLERTTSAVLAERVTDLIALTLLMGTGFLTFRRGAPVLIVVGAALLCFILVINSRRLTEMMVRLVGRLPLLRRFESKAAELVESTRALFRPLPLLVASLLSVVSWSAECLGTYLIFNGFPDMQSSLLSATFIYTATTLSGVPSPGGLGITDGSMATLAHYLAKAPLATAAAATLLVRISTLWFAVLVGAIALLSYPHSGDDLAPEVK